MALFVAKTSHGCEIDETEFLIIRATDEESVKKMLQRQMPGWAFYIKELMTEGQDGVICSGWQNATWVEFHSTRGGSHYGKCE